MIIEFQKTCPYCGGGRLIFKKESLLGNGYMLTKCRAFSCGNYFHMKFGNLTTDKGNENDTH